MKKLALLFTITFLLNSCYQGNKTEFEVGNLWKITSKKGIESYIFGTIHLYPKKELELPKNAISKLKDCKILALERDVTNKIEQQKFMDFEMPEYFTKTNQVLFSEYGNELVSMEGLLIKIANKNGIIISGLESTEEILEIMTAMGKIEFSQSEFEKEKIIRDYKLVLDLYKKEQILIFKDTMVSQLPTKMVDLSVNIRNENWIEDIIKLVEEKPTFIAVGMGHLGGKNGLLKLLRDNEYRLERI